MSAPIIEILCFLFLSLASKYFLSCNTCSLDAHLQYIPKYWFILEALHLCILPFPYSNKLIFPFWVFLYFYKQQFCHVNTFEVCYLNDVHWIIFELDLVSWTREWIHIRSLSRWCCSSRNLSCLKHKN